MKTSIYTLKSNHLFKSHLTVLASIILFSLNACTKATHFSSVPVTKQALSGGGLNSNNPPPPTTIVDEDVSDVFNVSSVRKADLLFVVDNSGSMGGEQTILANSFSGFINSFITKSVDANIGIISTDVRPANAPNGTWNYSAYTNYPNAGPGRLLSRTSGETFLNTISSQNLVSKFTQNANLGTNGSGDEKALQSMQLALDPSMLALNGYNQNFVRDNSLLVTILVGDEDNGLHPNDFSIANAQAVIDATTSIVNSLKANQGGSRYEFVINKSIALPNPLPTYVRSNCGSGCPELKYPAVFRQFAGGLGIPESGLVDIASDFTQALIQMGDSISTQAQKQFVLSKTPLLGSIHVYIDLVEINEDPNNGWQYIASNNSIELNGSALQNSLGHQLKVDYLGH